MVTLEQVALWLEEDGHSGCAEDLRLAAPADRARVARECADHCETDPYFDDGHAQALPGQIREWADELDLEPRN